MPLPNKATREVIISEVNRHTLILDALLAFAQGDDDALTRLSSTPSPTGEVAPKSTAIVPAQAAFKPETTAIAIPGAVVAIDDYKCKCKMAVKDKNSATQLCLLCKRNAYENYYVFAHTDEGRALMAGQQTIIDEFHAPDGEDGSTPVPALTAAITSIFLPTPDFSTFAPASEDEDGEES